MNFEDYFYYDETSPSYLRWKVNRYAGQHYNVLKVSAGDCAGSLRDDGYYSVRLDNRPHLVHRVIMEMRHGPSTQVCDHIDGNRANNVVGNLRYVTRAENSQNAGISTRNTSGVVGVAFRTVYCDTTGKLYSYCVATWTSGRKTRKKAFSVDKFGKDAALKMATDYRNMIIEELNKAGAGYTDSHGIRESY